MSDVEQKATAGAPATVYDMLLEQNNDPPVFVPKDLTIRLGEDGVNFLTQRGETVNVDITDPNSHTESVNIPLNDWQPSMEGNYVIQYNYKGGSTSGNINVTVSG